MSSDASGWLEKARDDLDVVRRTLIPMPDVNLKAAAYHLQQAAEKSLKALHVHLGIAYPRGAGRGHDLNVLAAGIPAGHLLHAEALGLAPLTPWATAYRYPADDPALEPPPPTLTEIEANSKRHWACG